MTLDPTTLPRYQLTSAHGERFVLAGPDIVVGSAADCTIRLAHPGITPHHARFRRHGATYYLEDVSGGATRRNGVVVHRPVPLVAGDRIDLGPHTIFKYGTLQGDLRYHPDVVAALAVQPLPAALVPRAPAALARVGCSACFETINPADPDPQRRAAVKVKQQHYHEQCWQRLHPTSGAAVPAIIPLPTPLPVLHRTPVSLYAGPLNTINDRPLGISHSTLTLEPHVAASFTIVNNSDSPVTIERARMPAWATIDYERPDPASAHVVLHPGAGTTVRVYPSAILPAMTQYDLMLSADQSIELEGNQSPVGSLGSSLGLLLLGIIHLTSMLGAVVGGRLAWNAVATAFFSLAAIFGTLLFIAPGWTLWRCYGLFDALPRAIGGPGSIPHRLVQPVQNAVGALITYQASLRRTGEQAPRLLETALLAGGAAGLVTLIGLTGLRLLPGVAPLLLLLYAGVLFWGLHRLWLSYGFNVFNGLYRTGQALGRRRS